MARKSKDHKRPNAVSAQRSRGLDANIQDHIGERLKSVYQSIADEPVPDRFVELLKRLDAGRTDTDE